MAPNSPGGKALPNLAVDYTSPCSAARNAVEVRAHVQIRFRESLAVCTRFARSDFSSRARTLRPSEVSTHPRTDRTQSIARPPLNFDTANTFNVYNTDESEKTADLKALTADWCAVGEDLEAAIEQYGRERA